VLVHDNIVVEKHKHPGLLVMTAGCNRIANAEDFMVARFHRNRCLLFIQIFLFYKETFEVNSGVQYLQMLSI
jgi:hypothetical protein